MNKTLSEAANVKVRDQWRTLKAVLVSSSGGKTVEYIDADGYTIHTEAFSKSQFKDTKTDD